MRFLRQGRLSAPEIDSVDWAGDASLLAPLRGRVVLLDFFSYADPEGVRSLQRVRDLGDHYREAGLAIVGIHVPAYEFERSPEDARREIWRLGVPYPVALDQDFRLFRAYALDDLPTRVLVDMTGMIRGWAPGEGSYEAMEHAVRTLLTEVDSDRKLPPLYEPEDDLPRDGTLCFLPTPEIRFGARGVGFGPPDGESADGEPPNGGSGDAGPPEDANGGAGDADPPEEANGSSDPAGQGSPGQSSAGRGAADGDADESTRRDFEMPELRAEGRAYLDGQWELRSNGITLHSEDGGVAVVYEGASVSALVSLGDAQESAEIEITLDGEPVPAELAGADLNLNDESGRSGVSVGCGRIYELISCPEVSVHNLDLRVRGRSTSLHLLSFGTRDVPPAS